MMNKMDRVDVNQEFFVIDSKNFEKVESKLYGFTLINGLPVNDIKIVKKEKELKDGAFIYISKEEDKILIMQDYVGAYGLYLYRDDNYFALSNSFFRLVEHLKKEHKITLNRDYATSFIPIGLCAISHSETLINEITLLDRNVIVEISLKTGTYLLKKKDYGENTVDISSQEGLSLLDNWYNKWTGIIHNLASCTSNIQTDLSGGYDSRIILALFLGAGIDMNNIYVHSIDDDLYTHKEDFEIASMIAEYFKFSLNNTQCLRNRKRYYTEEEILNISFYLKLGCHKQMHYQTHCYETPNFSFCGSGGECIRSFWNMSIDEYINTEIRACKNKYNMVSKDYTEAVCHNLQRTVQSIKEKYAELGRPILDEYLLLNLYRETRSRTHFGKEIIEKMYGNTYRYTPLLDSDLQKLKLYDNQCQDKNLLMALIFTRYNSDLLNFKFEGGRHLEEKTIDYAKKINEKYPFQVKKNTNVINARENLYVIQLPSKDNHEIKMEKIVESVKNIFYSRKIYSAFMKEYDSFIYEYIAQDVESRKYHPLQDAHTVIAISKVIEDCDTYKNLHTNSIAEYFSQNNIPYLRENINLLSHKNLLNYATARVDIRNNTKLSTKIIINNIDDSNAIISNPKWLDSNGNGYIIESIKGSIKLDVLCEGEGILEIALRGKDVRDINKNRVPIWVKINKVLVDEKEIITSPCAVSHDLALKFSYKVKTNQIVHLHLEWEPNDICVQKNEQKYKEMKKKILRKIYYLFSK